MELIKYNKKIQNKLDINIIDYKLSNKKIIIYEDNEHYLNRKGKRKVKEYNNEGKLIFEGEYLNGKRNGKGKEYDYKGNLIFEGEYLNGKEMEKEKNIINIKYYILKENIQMGKNGMENIGKPMYTIEGKKIISQS